MAIWASNGAQTGGSGGYSPGTQSVNYILANFAATGDTITLPAGTFTWTSTTSVTISVTIEGVNPGVPGNEATAADFTTVIENDNSTPANLISCVAPLNGHITIAYILFKQIFNVASGAAYTLVLDRSDLSGNSIVQTPYTCLVHDCYFDSGTVFTYMVEILCIGVVIWQCTCTSENGVNTVCGIENVPSKYGPTLNWNVPDTIGGSATTYGVGDTASGWAGYAGVNNTYIETCFLANGPSTVVDAGSDSRLVVRYCTFQDSLTATHGSTGTNAAKHLEAYNNTFNTVNGSLGLSNYIGCRSGILIVNNNTFNTLPSGKNACITLFVEQVNRTNFGGPAQPVYPANRQIAYSWSLAQQNAATTLSGNISGTNVTGLSSTAALVEGQQVSGTGVTAGTLVATIVSTTAITLTQSATTGTGVSLTFTGIPYGFPPFLAQGEFGNPTLNGPFGYGQQLDPCYFWNNTYQGGALTNSNIFVDQYTPDNFGNNLTIAGTIWFNQEVSAFSASATTSLAATFPGHQSSNVAFPGSWSNDLLLCMVSWTTSGSPTVTVTDATGSNTWTQIGSTYNASTGISQAIFAAINETSTAAFAVTVHFSTSVTNLCMNIADYAGNWISVNQLQSITTDGSNQNASTSSTSLSSGNITTTSNAGGNDLIIVWAKSGGTPTGVSSGWTQQAYDSTNHFGFYDNVGSGGSGGSFSTTGTFGLTATTTAPWTVSLISFQSMPFLLAGRDFYLGTAMPSYTPYTYPHPLTQTGNINPTVSGTVSVTGSVTPIIVGAIETKLIVQIVYP